MVIKTELGKAERDRVLIRGVDLTGELLGTATFSDMLMLVLLGRLPAGQERRMIDALLVVLVEHGLVKPALVARMVYSNAPESMQAAVAAALLGAGSKHLGSSEHCAKVLSEAVAASAPQLPLTEIADAVVRDHAARHSYIPGIGHRTHAGGDPRAIRLFEIARETSTYGRHAQLIEEISRVAGASRGREFPVNVTGAIAGIALDMGFRWEITRAFALIGRTLGAVAHIQEEMEAPIADEVKDLVLRAAETGAAK